MAPAQYNVWYDTALAVLSTSYPSNVLLSRLRLLHAVFAKHMDAVC